MSIGDSAAALADGEAAISAKADWAKGYSRKGAALHAMKKYDEAEAAYAAGLVAVPGDASLEAALKEVRVCDGGVGGGARSCLKNSSAWPALVANVQGESAYLLACLLAPYCCCCR